MPADSDKIFRSARWLRYTLVLAMLMVVAANMWLWWRGEGRHGTGWIAIYSEWPADLRDHAWVPLLAATFASVLLLIGLYRLCRLMRLFEAGEFFSVAAIRHLRAFALTLIGAVATNVSMPPLLLLGLHLSSRLDAPAVSLQLDAADLWTVLVGALFFLITSIMAEAHRLAEDNRQIV